MREANGGIKKIWLAIFFMVLPFCGIVAGQESYAEEIAGSCGKNAKYSFDGADGTMTITGLGEIDADWKKAIQKDWEYKIQKDVRCLVFKEGITNVPAEMMKDAAKLEKVELPDSLEEIGDNAFSGCRLLKTITIPKNVTKKTSGAFKNSHVEEAIFAEGSKVIACQLFLGCTSLKKVKFPDTLQVIRASAFSGCRNLAAVSLPDKIEEIHYEAFRDCEAIKEITIPETLKSGGTGCFAGSGVEKATFQNGTVQIPSQIFDGCTNIKQLVLPDSVEVIQYAAFSGCTSLKLDRLPVRLTEIGNNAFYNCEKITEVQFPVTLKKIGDYAYFGTAVSKASLPPHIEAVGYMAFNKSTLICGEDDTQAESYAKKYGNPYSPTKRSMKNVSIAPLPYQAHTGNAVMPQPVVSDGGTVLQPNVHYTIAYQDNVNFGTAKITITGTNAYYFGTRTVNFAIIAPAGGIYKVGNLRYKVTNSDIGGKGTAEVLGLVQHKTSATIPATVKIGKYKYQITSIAKKAFYKKNKLKTIKIYSSYIKTIGSYAVKKIHKEARIKVPAKKKKSYIKMLKKAGLGKKTKVT